MRWRNAGSNRMGMSDASCPQCSKFSPLDHRYLSNPAWSYDSPLSCLMSQRLEVSAAAVMAQLSPD